MAGNFVIRKALPTVENQRLFSEAHSGLQNHTGGHEFSPLRIGDAENRYLADRWMPEMTASTSPE
jgi:hypothetical protein